MFYVYCNSGGCNDGDHTAELTEYKTLKEAADYCKHLVQIVGVAEDEVKLIEGQQITEIPVEVDESVADAVRRGFNS